MAPKDLATCLNVSQCQIHRLLSADDTGVVTVSRYALETWAREMRNAEMYLRVWIRTADPRHAPENCSECGHPFNNANPSPSGKCRACEA